MSMLRRELGINNLANKLISMKEAGSAIDSTQYKKASDSRYSDLEKNIDRITDPIVSDFVERGVGLNEAIAKLADTEGLNNDEINRVVQKVNMKIYKILYDKTLGKDNREVVFDIANPQKVLEILGRGSAVPEAQNGDTSQGAEEKTASAKKRDIADIILDYTPAERFIGYERPVADFKTEFNINKLAAEVEKEKSDFEKVSNELNESIGVLGVAFAKYASRKTPYQEVFNRMCAFSGLRKKDQLLVKEAFEKYKGFYKVAEETTLELFDIDSYEDFSLGKHSISKQADDTVATLPEVVDSKKTIRDFEQLVNLAVKIQSDQNVINEISAKLSDKQGELDNLSKI